MILLSALACVSMGIAIKRVVDYCRWRNGYSSNKAGSSKSDSSLEEDKRTLYLIAEGARRRREMEREQSQRPIILIKDSKVFLVKGDDDEC